MYRCPKPIRTSSVMNPSLVMSIPAEVITAILPIVLKDVARRGRTCTCTMAMSSPRHSEASESCLSVVSSSMSYHL